MDVKEISFNQCRQWSIYSIVTIYLGVSAHAHPEGHLPVTSRLAHNGDSLLEEVGSQVSSDRWVSYLERQEFPFSENLAQFPSAYVPSALALGGRGAGVSTRGGSVDATGIQLNGLRVGGNAGVVRDLLRFGSIYGYEEVEQLRGAQGAMHGNNASAGMLGVFPQYGDSVASGKLSLEYGSRGNERFSLMQSGESDVTTYGLAGDWSSVEDLERWSLGGTVSWQMNDYVQAYFTARSWSGRADGEEWDANVVTLGLKAEVNSWWQSHFLTGFYRDDLNGDRDRSYETVQARWYHQFAVADAHRLHLNLAYEQNDLERRAAEFGEDVIQAQLGWSWDVVESLTIATDGMWQRSSDFGHDAASRVAVVWRVNEHGTILRASHGTAFDYLSNGGRPSVRGAKVWDVGFEQTWRGTDRLSFAYFDADHADEEAARGIEFRLRGQIGEQGAGYRASYTHLFDARSDLPRNSFSGSLDLRFFDKLVLGLGLDVHSGADVAGEDLASFGTTRFFAEYLLRDGVRIHGRVENLFDKNYSVSSLDGEILEGRGMTVYGGISFEW